MRITDLDKQVLAGIKNKPILDPGFIPAVFWNRRYREIASGVDGTCKFVISIENHVGNVYSYETVILPHEEEFKELNIRYVERLLKFLLWMRGGSRIFMTGNKELFNRIKEIYSETGTRAFDNNFIGKMIYDMNLKFYHTGTDFIPESYDGLIKLGGHTEGNRIGIDIGGTNKKYAIVVDGKQVFAEAIPWNPRGQNNPAWFKREINELIDLASARLEKIDAIGVSSAGVFILNRIKGGVIFSGVPEERRKRLADIFLDIAEERNIPVDIANDGEVTALAGAITLKVDSLLGIAMGTGLGAGYVNSNGNITDRLNELGHVPIDYRLDGLKSTWSGGIGLGEEYLSIKVFPYLAQKAGIETNMLASADIARMCNDLSDKNDKRAIKVYQTIGAYLAYAVAHYKSFYEFKNILLLGGVTMGTGGDIIASEAQRIISEEFPEIYSDINFLSFESEKRHKAMAIAAATLTEII